MKKEAGTVVEERLAEDVTVTAPAVATGNVKEIGRKVVSRVLKERAVELMELVRDQLNRAGNRDQLVAGAVLTGGGSLLDGMLEVAERVLEVPIRAGMPQSLAGLPAELSHPVYATAVGLALLAAATLLFVAPYLIGAGRHSCSRKWATLSAVLARLAVQLERTSITRFGASPRTSRRSRGTRCGSC